MVFDFTQATMGHANLRSHLVNALQEKEQMDDGEVEELVRAVVAAYRKYNG
jgi:DNA-binding IclR family transcriptional regulator